MTYGGSDSRQFWVILGSYSALLSSEEGHPWTMLSLVVGHPYGSVLVSIGSASDTLEGVTN